MTEEKNTQKILKSIIVIDKPHGITSMTVVRKLRRLLKPLNVTKVGYAGTLDPYATGVLVVGVGRDGTRQLGDLTDKNKEYVCEIDLLKDSFSGDMEDFKEEYQRDVSKDLPKDFQPPTLDQIKELIRDKFVGEIKQTPPKLSAIKMNGKKACDMVRNGDDFEMKERTVTLFETEVLEYVFPVLKLRVKCSKGTYIRTLGQDIGKNLGLWGTLLSLRRTVSGDHSLKDALNLDTMTLSDLII
ncbi:tRNA pseudouridine(55) synthase TruB [Yasminevirus sp. GU-2018]|uniref:tRNA pseudouridine(55) synthase n=1 Tax=Yasminevirus sp. GU-2018 TaxID=2420051 RepID=A0A5K0U9Q4_9VIRU|nr:tRNA pseudouridine(55) synthase TruB [Yasminevirus sp. GU-2018]